MTVCVIYSLLFSATFLGVGRRGGPSFILYPAKTDMVGCPPILFIFTKCISTPCIFSFTGFSSMSDMYIYSRDPLWSWGSFSLLMSPTFSEDSPKWSTNFSELLIYELTSLFFTISLEISALVVRLLCELPLVWRWFFLGALTRPKVLPDSRGISDVLGGTVPLLWASTGKSSPRLLLSLSIDKESFKWAAYLLSDGITSLAVFPRFLWVGEDKNRGNIIIG